MFKGFGKDRAAAETGFPHSVFPACVVTRAFQYGLVVLWKNVVFPLTLGRAALFRRLAFPLFQR